MRNSVSLLVLSLALGAVGCEVSTGDEEDDGTGTGRVGRDAGERGTPVTPGNGGGGDAGTGSRDAQVPAASDASAQASDASTTQSDASAPSGTDTAQTPEQCKPALPTASVACTGPDAFEPNNEKASAIQLSTGTGCALVPGKLSSGDDQDWYLFTSPKADPVLIELAYETTPTGAPKLGFYVYDASTSSWVIHGTGREDIKWTVSDTLVVKKNIAYQVEVADEGNLEGCQGYNLRVDPQFCTDAFEDNDTRATPAAGITAGTTISATSFRGDEDWYDVSVLQAAGATCVITSEIAATASQKVQLYSYKGDSWQVHETLSGTKNSVTITIAANSGVGLLNITADDDTCTKYTVLCTPL